MNKEAAIPQGFPVGRVRLTKHLSASFRARQAGGGTRPLPPMITPYGGTAPARKHNSTLQGDVRSIQARREGTLSQFLAGKSTPQNLQTQYPPTLATASIPPDVVGEPQVQHGTGTVRDVAKS